MTNFEEELGKLLVENKLKVATAESCTGGLIANRITNVSGSSEYFHMGVVTYSNSAKINLLNIPIDVIEKYGAVSEQTAIAMANGIKNLATTDFGLGVTGIAGPTGGSPEKPVGLVYIALAVDAEVIYKKFNFSGTRLEIKQQTSDTALNMIIDYIKNRS